MRTRIFFILIYLAISLMATAGVSTQDYELEARDDHFTASTGFSSFSAYVFGNDTYPSWASFYYAGGPSPVGGVNMHSNGFFDLYGIPSDFVGSISFQYGIFADGESSEATVTLEVTGEGNSSTSDESNNAPLPNEAKNCDPIEVKHLKGHTIFGRMVKEDGTYWDETYHLLNMVDSSGNFSAPFWMTHGWWTLYAVANGTAPNSDTPPQVDIEVYSLPEDWNNLLCKVHPRVN